MVKLSDVVSSSRRKSRKVFFASRKAGWPVWDQTSACSKGSTDTLYGLSTGDLFVQNHFSATSVQRHKIMSSHLNKELREKYQVCFTSLAWTFLDPLYATLHVSGRQKSSEINHNAVAGPSCASAERR